MPQVSEVNKNGQTLHGGDAYTLCNMSAWIEVPHAAAAAKPKQIDGAAVVLQLATCNGARPLGLWGGLTQLKCSGKKWKPPLKQAIPNQKSRVRLQLKILTCRGLAAAAVAVLQSGKWKDGLADS
jgi:hypothetical protein